MVNPWPLYGDKGLKVDFISEKKYSKKWAGVSPQKCGLTPPGGQIQNGRQQNNCLAFNDPK